MKLSEAKFGKFALVKEMLETPEIVGSIPLDRAAAITKRIMATGRLFLTGEGSSRIFPSKNLISEILRQGIEVAVSTEGGRQAAEYQLGDAVVFGASNSGR
ncbi:MAG: sugar isomerase, partial [Planctomycetia bacterium]|nr:sugar isomerase [Planctomycetia bacterium]